MATIATTTKSRINAKTKARIKEKTKPTKQFDEDEKQRKTKI
jgi:hypothetical protein